jgi:hypothetical protein
MLTQDAISRSKTFAKQTIAVQTYLPLTVTSHGIQSVLTWQGKKLRCLKRDDEFPGHFFTEISIQSFRVAFITVGNYIVEGAPPAISASMNCLTKSQRIAE